LAKYLGEGTSQRELDESRAPFITFALETR